MLAIAFLFPFLTRLPFLSAASACAGRLPLLLAASIRAQTRTGPGLPSEPAGLVRADPLTGPISLARFLQSQYASRGRLGHASSPYLTEQSREAFRAASQSSSVPSLHGCLTPPSEPDIRQCDQRLRVGRGGGRFNVFVFCFSSSPLPHGFAAQDREEGAIC